MANENLETIIEDSVNDAASPDPEPVDTTDQVDASDESTADEVVESSQAPTPASSITDTDEAVDEFGKRFGLQGQSITGRENRIPYSRVKKIVERAEKEASDKLRKELEGTAQPKLVEYETKLKDYEGRLGRVAEFEQLIEHRPQEFLNFLSTLPAYKEFFTYLNQLVAQTPQQETAKVAGTDGLDLAQMPQPDQPLPDGTRVYSLEGLQKLLAWQAQQVEARTEKRVIEQVDKRFGPMQQAHEAEQRRQQAIPVIQKQIAEARTWPFFTDHEADILQILTADQNISLDGAYRKVMAEKILPKLQQTRDNQRKDILDELKKKPSSTAAPTSQVKPGKTPAGPRSLEEVISEAVQSIKQ